MKGEDQQSSIGEQELRVNKDRKIGVERSKLENKNLNWKLKIVPQNRTPRMKLNLVNFSIAELLKSTTTD